MRYGMLDFEVVDPSVEVAKYGLIRQELVDPDAVEEEDERKDANHQLRNRVQAVLRGRRTCAADNQGG